MTTAKQLAADKANLAKARTANHKPRTAKQIAASKANLSKANAARSAKARARSAAHVGALRKGTLSHHRGRPAIGTHRAPLGSHRSAANLHAGPTHHKITGVNHKFVKRLSPSGFGTRGSWKSSRAHHFRKRLALRKKKTIHVKTWHHRKHRQTPR